MSSTTPPDQPPDEPESFPDNGRALWPTPEPQSPAEPQSPEPVRETSDDPRVQRPLPAPRGRAGWLPWTAWTAILLGFGVTIVGGIVVSVIAAAAAIGSLDDPAPGVNIGLTLFQNIALVGAALFFAAMAGRPTAADFGLVSPAHGVEHRSDQLRAIRRAVGLLLGLWIGFYAVSAIWAAALSLDERQTLPDELGIDGSAINLALVVVMITVVAPLGEELFFRGYFFGALRNWRGFWPAAIVTGVVFGAIHIGSAPIGFTVPLAFFGFALCLLYERTGSLYPSIALHALNNSVALGSLQDWSWQIPLLMVGAVVGSLTLARALGHTLQTRADKASGPFAQPAA